MWDPSTNPDYCEVWIEKDALTGVFYDVTNEFDVPLMPCKGYPSLSFIRQAAESIVRNLQQRSDHLSCLDESRGRTSTTTAISTHQESTSAGARKPASGSSSLS